MPGWAALLLLLSGLLGGAVVFVLLWAGLNIAWAAALDHVIGPAIVAQPCQQVAGVTDWPTRFSRRETGRTGRLLSRAVCHFGDRAAPVPEEVWSREFWAGETVLLMVGLVGYFLCIFGAIIGTVWLLILGRRGLDRARRGWGRRRGGAGEQGSGGAEGRRSEGAGKARKRRNRRP
jgi:hypothetical protein